MYERPHCMTKGCENLTGHKSGKCTDCRRMKCKDCGKIMVRTVVGKTRCHKCFTARRLRDEYRVDDVLFGSGSSSPVG